ncbi:Uncharacterised protein [Bordetella pertussis]|nr:Uncharacterised protein [Bordetella pertussis]
MPSAAAPANRPSAETVRVRRSRAPPREVGSTGGANRAATLRLKLRTKLLGPRFIVKKPFSLREIQANAARARPPAHSGARGIRLLAVNCQ